MARPATRKTFKIEIEVSVEMDQISAQHLLNDEPSHHLTNLESLQNALMQDERALLHQMLLTALQKAHEYSDYLAAQDELASLMRVAETLPAEEWDFFAKPVVEFTELTRPLRTTCLSAQIEGSTVYEKIEQDEATPRWQPFWSDLQPSSQLSRLLAQYPAAAWKANPLPVPEADHYLSVRYQTMHTDGVHIEAGCTCGQALHAVGLDEFQALEELWAAYQEHYESSNVAVRLLRRRNNSWMNRLPKK